MAYAACVDLALGITIPMRRGQRENENEYSPKAVERKQDAKAPKKDVEGCDNNRENNRIDRSF